MGTTTRRYITVGIAGATALLVLAAARPAAIELQPGEIVLTEAEQAQVLHGADKEERGRLAAMFRDDDRYLPVAYTRAHFRVTVTPDGRATVSEVGAAKPTEGSNLRLPALATSASSGATGRYDLYASVGIARLGGPGFRWVIASFFKWNGSNGIDPCNLNEDSIAAAWAGGLALYSDASYGYYQRFGGTTSPLDIYRSDVAPNLGVGWSFHELKQRGSQICTNVNWGEGDAYISQPSWQSRTSNVTMKYVHTKASASYSLGFGLPGGVSPSISVSPADGNQWTAAAFATFNH
jgi:hypothetical protein